jgi:hypothetical protein
MSTRVLVIPEDFRKDQYMLKPLIEALFSALEKPNVRVEVCTRPLLTGITQAMNKEWLAEIIEEYQGMVDLFLLCVDRDCHQGRKRALDEREEWAQESYGCTLIAGNAWQELEVWVLAGHDNLPQEWEWRAIRDDCDPKEMYFIPFAEQQQVLESPGEGRKILAEAAARRYNRIKQLCPEDIETLESSIKHWLNQQ